MKTKLNFNQKNIRKSLVLKMIEINLCYFNNFRVLCNPVKNCNFTHLFTNKI